MKLSQKYDARKKRDERKRMRAMGFILRQMWVHPQDWASVSKMVNALRDDRKDGA
jgi:hypothetical protein